ncbi:MAG: hypothetical protein KC996_10755 [Phycisphaerales bacterium]|nr:hypothetical protein [Phycisphaerales bacterium]
MRAMTSYRLSIVPGLLVLTWGSMCHAELVMTVDTSSHLLWITGETSGSLVQNPGSNLYFAEWGNPTDTENDSWLIGSLLPLVESTSGSVDHFKLGFTDQNTLQLSALFRNAGTNQVTLSGTGLHFDYSVLQNEAVMVLEASDDVSLMLDNGTGFDPFTINVIPSPSVCSILAIGGITLNRRSRNSTSR